MAPLQVRHTEDVLLQVDNIPVVDTPVAGIVLEVVVGEKHNRVGEVEAPDYPAIQDFVNYFHAGLDCSQALSPFPAALSSYDVWGTYYMMEVFFAIVSHRAN